MKKQTMIDQFTKARETGTPLVAIQTPDPANTISKIAAADQTSPLVQWDLCNGWRNVNTAGGQAMSVALEGADPSAATLNPVEQLIVAAKLPESSVLCVHNAQRYLTTTDQTVAAGFMQAVWNLRDPFKLDGRTLVLLGPSITLPSEIAQDVLVLDEPLPTDVELETIANELYESVGAKTKATPAVVGALRGLAPFPVEQVVSNALELNAQDEAVINMDGLYERSRRMIESTRGLSVYRAGTKFDDLGGLLGAKQFFAAYLAGRSRPNLIAIIDEIDKSAVVGGLGDSSGTSTDFLGVTLTTMNDFGWTGPILYGHPGTGKTALAKALGGEIGVPTIYVDMGAMKGSLVGESERYIREAYKLLRAVGGDRVLVCATCNEFAPIKPELKRRFGLPTFFFDLPTDDEKLPIWTIYSDRYEFVPADYNRVDDTGWTGAEIERCCRLAYDLSTVPNETFQYIIPVAQSSADDVARRRREADGKLLSASLPGVYRMFDTTKNVPTPRMARRVALKGASK